MYIRADTAVLIIGSLKSPIRATISHCLHNTRSRFRSYLESTIKSLWQEHLCSCFVVSQFPLFQPLSLSLSTYHHASICHLRAPRLQSLRRVGINFAKDCSGSNCCGCIQCGNIWIHCPSWSQAGKLDPSVDPEAHHHDAFHYCGTEQEATAFRSP